MSAPLDAPALQALMAGSPFTRFLGIEVEAADAERRVLDCRCAVRPEFERLADSGQWHGGVIASVIDTVGDHVVAMLVGRPLPTINFRTDYLKPAAGAALRFRATARRVGRSVAVADVDVTNEAGDLVAIGRATYAVA
jgi:uncharacterized protein (TIGR00369 family)